MKRNRKIWLKWILRLLGTGVFLGIILRSVDLQEILFLLQQVPVWGYILLFIAYLFNQLLNTYRWKILLDVAGVRVSIKSLYVALLYGQSINQILPSSIGGDSTRVAYLWKRYDHQRAESLSSTLLDRMLGLSALILIASINLPFVREFNPLQKITGVTIFGLIFLLFYGSFMGKLDFIIKGILGFQKIPDFFRSPMVRVWHVFQEFRNEKRGVLKAFFISLLTQSIMIFIQYFTFLLIGMDIPLMKLFLVIPIVTLIVALPISIGGIGVREAALVRFLDITNDTVLSFSLIRYSYYIFLPVILFIMSLFVDGWGDYEWEKDDG